MRYWLVVPAAGVGRRFGQALPKQYAPLAGRTVIEWAFAPFTNDSRCVGIAVALSAEDTQWAHLSARLPSVVATTGGERRCESVRNALGVLSRRAGKDDWVLVHDAARPCLTAADRDRLLDKVATHPVGGLLATPEQDTVKRMDVNGCVEQTLERGTLWRALTPQMFRYGKLCAALDQAIAAERFPTDEAQAIEWTGERPLLVEGSASNIKITSAEDLRIAEAWLSAGGAK